VRRPGTSEEAACGEMRGAWGFPALRPHPRPSSPHAVSARVPVLRTPSPHSSQTLRTAVLLCLLLVTAIDLSGAQAVVRLDSATMVRGARSGTWSAASGSLTLMGTWTAVADTAHSTVTGTWTLADAQAKTVAFGGWSAVKSTDRWAGAWRANVTGRTGEYSGTWTSSVDLKLNARFVDMFEKAAQTIVSGAWTTGGQSGGWSIRAAK
jgi:hypothetical protein